MGNKRKPLTQIPNGEVSKTFKRARDSENDESSNNNHQPRRAGTINKMVLKNFMCHSLLEVDFSSNISMIIGRNGSGKSAILTALVVGLGGKASVTNRGTSVKVFVKSGRPSASIQIVLCNEGPMAYRPNVYGPSITIIRNISASGGGTYRIKTHTGEVISTLSKEVGNITTGLNIQVDNPVCVLNQDTARNFLSSNDPKNKFTLFMRATRLEMLEQEYKTIVKNKLDSERNMEDKKTSFQNLQDKIINLRTQIKSHQQIVNLKDQKKMLQNELMWAKVRDSELELEQQKSIQNQCEQKVADARKNAENRDEKISGIRDNIVEIENKIKEINNQIDTQKVPINDIHHQLEELKRKCLTKRNERKTILASVEAKKQNATYLVDEIARANENFTLVEQQKTQRMRQLAALQDKLKAFIDQLEVCKNDLFQISSHLSKKEDDEHTLRKEITQIKQRIDEQERDLKALENESGNVLVLYGREIPQVKKLIQQYKNKFKQEPRGPLGHYVKLKNKKWAVAVEGYLQGTITAFAVDNQEDGRLLREIFSKCYERGGKTPTIITSKFIFQKHNVKGSVVSAPKNCTSLYNAVDIKDVIVSNCFVDQNGIESILLVPDDATAMELMSDRQRVPQNCKQTLTLTGDRYYPDPNYRTFASTYRRAKFLQVDTEEHKQNVQSNIETLKNNRDALINQLNELQNEMRINRAHKMELEEKIRKVNAAKVMINRQFEEINSSAEPDVQNVQFLTTDLEDINKEIGEKNAKVEELTQEMNMIKTEGREKEEKVEKLQQIVAKLQERIEPLKEQVRDLEAKRKEISTNETFLANRLAAYSTRLESAKREVKLKDAEIKVQCREAAAGGERMPELRQVTEITNQLNEITRSIGRIENTTENIIELSTQYNLLKGKYDKVKDIMKLLQSDVDELSIAVDKRKKYYKMTENYFITFIKISFRNVLEFRQFKGTINIDMLGKKLDLVVMPQQGTQGPTTTSNLSGGERSFSTVAFLYALWQCMDFPFYFLDEFDVYMDKLNRSKVIDILLHHANQHKEIQYVFLTPQDVSFIKQDVAILKLDDPKRANV